MMQRDKSEGFTPAEASAMEQLCVLAAPLLVAKLTQEASQERYTAIHKVTRALRVTVQSVTNVDVGSVTGLFGGAPNIKVEMEVFHGDVRAPRWRRREEGGGCRWPVLVGGGIVHACTRSPCRLAVDTCPPPPPPCPCTRRSCWTRR